MCDMHARRWFQNLNMFPICRAYASPVRTALQGCMMAGVLMAVYQGVAVAAQLEEEATGWVTVSTTVGGVT